MKKQKRTRRGLLLLLNVIAILAAAGISFAYSDRIRNEQERNRKQTFLATVESMKRVSGVYLKGEQGYVDNWAQYITSQGFTLEETLDFLRRINTNSERMAHIVDMTTFQAYSSFYPAGEEEIGSYLHYREAESESDKSFVEMMQRIFRKGGDENCVLGRYQIRETASTAVSVGNRITLKAGEGTKDYLLLRIIPTEGIKRAWVFPLEYQSAEVGIINKEGGYVVQSSSMKSSNFPEYIRGYNYQDDYNRINELRLRLQNTVSGELYYKDFRGRECLWYYSRFGNDSPLMILGMIPVDNLKSPLEGWVVSFMMCGTLFLLVIVDSLYLRGINRELRRTAERAEKASHAKTQFLSAMSHDIRTPMNAVLGMIDIARQNADNPEKLLDCLDKSKRAGKQLLTLINDVLDISKIESGKLVFCPERVDLQQMLTGLVDMTQSGAEQKNITLDCDATQLQHRYVVVDQLRLMQVYLNLISNAVKYTNEGGSIRIRVFEQEVAKRRDCTELVFEIRDTGIGMTEEFQKSMFNLFERAVSTQVNRTQGVGLGLAIVKQIVDQMEGSIHCESTVGEGTTFRVEVILPIAEDGALEARDSGDPEKEIGTLHLLAAEDNELNWEILKEQLEQYGIECDWARNGQECLELLQRAPEGTYDVILMDIQMPVLNGLEAAKQIRQLPEEQKRCIPIIAMTADAFSEDVRLCRESGMNGHVAKPLEMKRLLGCLQKVKNGGISEDTFVKS